MSHVKTSSGFECDIDEEALDDFRLTIAIREAQASQVAIVDVVRFILGEDGMNRLIAHLVETEGRPSHAAIDREITEIFAQLSESKKK